MVYNGTYILLILLAIMTSCSKPLKDVNEYFPQVTLTNVAVQNDGSVKLTAIVEDIGGSPISYNGFCYSTNSTPLMLDNQVIAKSGSSTFTAQIEGFDIDSIYYFRAWATNYYGYSYSDIIEVDSIEAIPVTPPCTLSSNYIDFGELGSSSYSWISSPSEDEYGNVVVNCSSLSGKDINITFGSKLKTGVYITTLDPSSTKGNGNVYINFTDGSLASGYKVYMNSLDSGEFEVTVCDVPWDKNGLSLIFNTRLTIPAAQ